MQHVLIAFSHLFLLPDTCKFQSTLNRSLAGHFTDAKPIPPQNVLEYKKTKPPSGNISKEEIYTTMKEFPWTKYTPNENGQINPDQTTNTSDTKDLHSELS